MEIFIDRPCCSGQHMWLNDEEARKCCAGFIPVRVPMDFWYTPEIWATEPVEHLYDYKSWIRILIPEQDTELFRRLWVRQPTAYQSSTGPINPGLHTEN